MKSIVHFSIALLTVFIAAQVRAGTSDLSISFNYPTNGQTVVGPLFLQASAGESSNTVVSVEYFADGQSIGIGSNGIVYPPGTGVISTIMLRPTVTNSIVFYLPFMLYWNPQPGDYVLTAQATDDQGNTAWSAPISVTAVPIPVLTVEATVAIASPNGPGVFTISRTGDTNADMQVWFSMSGSAQNGEDYTAVSNSVTIPAGSFSADVVINPLVFVTGKSKSVTLDLGNNIFVVPLTPVLYDPLGGALFPFNPPYLVGTPGQATVYLKTNNRDRHKPFVKLTQPRNGHQRFPLGTDITLTAETFDRDTYVAKVEFFDGGTKIGETPSVTTTPPGQRVSFDFVWTNAAIGIHVLHARATDNQGAAQVSGPVRIQVLPAP
jgi:hypothetical protein